MKKSKVIVLLSVSGILCLATIFSMVQLVMNELFTPPERGEECRAEWVCDDEDMKIVSFSEAFPTDLFTESNFYIKNEEFKYEATEDMGFLVADRFYDENVEDINIFEGHYYYDKDSVTLQMEKVYEKKYKYLQGKEYKFVLQK